jgi:hypothetical protein
MIIVLVAAVLAGCAPAAVIPPREHPAARFEPMPPYQVDLSQIQKPAKIEPVFVNAEFEETSPDQAVYVLLAPGEYAKVAALLTLIQAYKGIIAEQAVLINAHIDTGNALKEYVALEQAKAAAYRDLWIDSETAYRQERYHSRIDNAVNKGLFGVISIGAILVAILAL